MLSALFYLQYHSVKNRTLMRLKRLRQPKYLFGAVVGGLYFYFYFFRYAFGFSGSSRVPRGAFVLNDGRYETQLTLGLTDLPAEAV